MSRRILWSVAAGGALLLLAWWWRSRDGVASPAVVAGPSHASPAGPEKSAEPLMGEAILNHYADPAAPPEEDLTWMHRALDSFSLLVKGDDPLPLGANEDIADALRGRNKARLRFVPEDSPVFDAEGRIIDRWGTPLYFHASARARLEIRSAGPDRQMWTEDDLHRKPDGSFLRDEALRAPSLFDANPGPGPER